LERKLVKESEKKEEGMRGVVGSRLEKRRGSGGGPWVGTRKTLSSSQYEEIFVYIF